jgi:hypothetical protein
VGLKSVHFHTRLTVCLTCGELPEAITLHRAQEKPYVLRLLSAPLWPLQPQGLMLMFAIGVVRALLSYSPLGVLVSSCVLAAACFAMLRASARGNNDFELFDSTDLFNDLLAPGFKGLLAFLIVFAPAGLYAAVRLHGFSGEAGDAVMRVALDPVLWLALLAGIAWAPMAVMFAASGGGVLSMLNPIEVVRAASRLGPSYIVAIGVLCALTIPWLLAMGVGTLISAIPIPFIPRIIDYTLACYVPFIAVRVLGLLLYTHGDEVGYGVPGDYLVSVLPGVEPRGVVQEEPAAAAAVPKVDKYKPIELPDEPEAPAVTAPPEARREALRELDPSALPSLERFNAIELPEEPEAQPKPLRELDPALLPPLKPEE